MASNDEPVILDGAQLVGADLQGRLLIYRGGVIPNLAAVDARRARWLMEGSAANTLLFLAYLEKAMPGMTERILQTYRQQAEALYRKIPLS